MIKNNVKGIVLFFAIATLFIACGNGEKKDESSLKSNSWEEIAKAADAQTVNFMMWQGSPPLNDYMNNYVIPTLKEKYNIDLKISGGQGPEIIQLVMGEKEANIETGQVDIVWINGETFFQLRKIDGLYGPFVDQLPNSKLIDFTDKYISTDFQQPIDGMECPWSIGQSAMYYDSAKIDNPPTSLPELEAYVKKYPGTFTISNDFTGMTVMKSFLAELGGSPNSLAGPFNEEKYKKLSGQLWDFINRNKQYFWKKGETFPKEQTKVAQYFANGELNISYGFSEGGIDEKIKTGLYPKTTKAYPWKNGTIKNTNYLGIVTNAPQKAAAMMVINFLISPEAQFIKATNEMDSNTVLSIDKLPAEWKEKFENKPKKQYGLEMEDLKEFAFEEPAPEYMLRLYEDFRTQVIEK